MSDLMYESGYKSLPSAPRRPVGWLVATFVVPIIAICVSFLIRPTGPVFGYAVALVLGTLTLATYRYREGKNSTNPAYTDAGGMRRAATAATILVLAACAVSGWLLATELAKQ